MSTTKSTKVRTFAQQKAALTRAVKTGNVETVRAEVKRAIAEWDSREGQFRYGWPDDWHRWNRALNDMLPWNQQVDIDTL